MLEQLLCKPVKTRHWTKPIWKQKHRSNQRDCRSKRDGPLAIWAAHGAWGDGNDVIKPCQDPSYQHECAALSEFPGSRPRSRRRDDLRRSLLASMLPPRDVHRRASSLPRGSLVFRPRPRRIHIQFRLRSHDPHMYSFNPLVSTSPPRVAILLSVRGPPSRERLCLAVRSRTPRAITASSGHHKFPSFLFLYSNLATVI